MLSTLVLEHLPLHVFFRTVKTLLKEDGGVVVLTNMHAGLGSRSQAGFMDEETGSKVQGVSFVYEVDEVLEEAKNWGVKLVGDVSERAVEREDLKTGLVGKRGEKWIGIMCWFGMVLKLGDDVRN